MAKKTIERETEIRTFVVRYGKHCQLQLTSVYELDDKGRRIYATVHQAYDVIDKASGGAIWSGDAPLAKIAMSMERYDAQVDEELAMLHGKVGFEM